MQKMMQGVPGIVCCADDILVSDQGNGQVQHDANLAMALQWLSDAGATLMNDKCEFIRPSVVFWGNQIIADGIKQLLERTQAIMNMPNLKNITEVKRLLGMANQLDKYAQSLAEDSTPLRSLLVKNAAWTWGPAQEEAVRKVKQTLCSSEILDLYDAGKETIVTADASSHGIGSALLQVQEDGTRRPVTYASRSITEREQRYA